MRYYHPFEHSGYSFAERLGAPDPISAAIGQIVLRFAALEAHLTARLIHLLEGDESWTPLLDAGQARPGPMAPDSLPGTTPALV
jgi:hypothetical protein